MAGWILTMQAVLFVILIVHLWMNWRIMRRQERIIGIQETTQRLLERQDG